MMKMDIKFGNMLNTLPKWECFLNFIFFFVFLASLASLAFFLFSHCFCFFVLWNFTFFNVLFVVCINMVGYTAYGRGLSWYNVSIFTVFTSFWKHFCDFAFVLVVLSMCNRVLYFYVCVMYAVCVVFGKAAGTIKNDIICIACPLIATHTIYEWYLIDLY